MVRDGVRLNGSQRLSNNSLPLEVIFYDEVEGVEVKGGWLWEGMKECGDDGGCVCSIGIGAVV